MRQGEGLRVWFGTHSREEMEGEGKRNIRRIALISRGFAQVTRKEWERVKFKAMLEGKKVCFQGNM